MKKLLFVLNADWYFDLHWKERAVDAIANGFDVHVALPTCSDVIKNKLLVEGLKIHIFCMNRTKTSFFKEISAIGSLKKIFDIVVPDLVHSVTIKPNVYCSFLCFWRKIPLVSTYAGLGTLKISTDFKYRLVKGVVFQSIKFFSKNLKVKALFENQEDLDFFEHNNYIAKANLVRVFGAGVNLEQYSYEPSKYQQGSINILFASRLLKDKGLMSLVNAVRLVQKDGIKVNLYIAGIYDFESPLAFSENDIMELEQNGDIIWLGKRDDISSLIAESDIVALPTSYGEGVPRILIEACAVGRPIITTKLGGCKDICKDGVNGYLVLPNCANEIASSIKKVYKNPSLINEFGLKGRELVEKKFSNESVFKQNLFIYNSLLVI